MLEYKFTDGDTVTFTEVDERVYVRWDIDKYDREMTGPLGYWDQRTKKFVSSNPHVIWNVLLEMGVTGMTLEDFFS